MEVGVPYEFDVSHRCLHSPNDEFLLIDSIIDVDFGLPVKYDLPMHGSPNFGVNVSLLVYYTKVGYMTEDFKVDNTCIQVTMNRFVIS